MDEKEAKRLLQICIPQMTNNDKGQTKLWLDELSKKNKNVKCQSICRLWGGMGYVYEVSMDSHDNEEDTATPTMIVKRISPLPPQNSNHGDRRKAESYQVEANFYQNLAPPLLHPPQHHHFPPLTIPHPYHVERRTTAIHDPITICMSKLHGHAPYAMDTQETFAVLRWFATFHASTWGPHVDKTVADYGLQPQGTYWYLDTRLDEHQSMSRKGWHGRLRNAAKAIDTQLKRNTKLHCCVHGDAKDANMLFHHDKDDDDVKHTSQNNDESLHVSMYDFQYCGKGPCTKDLAYFLCVAVQDRNDSLYVPYYHKELVQRLKLINKHTKKEETFVKKEIPSLQDIEESLQLAYCDWVRFMCGWGMWGHDMTEEVKAVLDRLDGGRNLGSEDAYDEAVQREFG